jgi:dUTP pyrophosphatase
MDVKIKKLRNIPMPSYATDGSVGLDLYAAHEVVLYLNKPMVVNTGIAIELPEGYEAQIRPRSGLSANGVNVAFGTIDTDYRGEIGVIMTFIKYSDNPKYIITKGQRIAQLVIAPIVKANLIEVESLTDTERGAGGFGSTGM